MGTLDGKVAVVTGAALGNGRAIAVRFAAAGADVALADIDEAHLQETAAMVREHGRSALEQRCDVAVKADLDRLMARTVTEFGGIDIAVANAGVVEHDTDCLRMTEGEWSAPSAST